MKAYLDNSATTRTFDEVTEYMGNVMHDIYGNPSSMHMEGVNAENEVKKAKETIAGVMKVDPKEILFTSGGTESDNLALIGCAVANRRSGMHIVTTKIEHPAILETAKHLEEMGYTISYLSVRPDGTVDPEVLREALTHETTLVSIMHVNNEIGSRNDIAELSRVVKEYDPSILFHTDAVQSFGKMNIFPKREKVDLVSVSGHKIHGPKGVGFLYIGENVKINPILFGGGQQKGLRPGTENVPGIAGLGLATKLIYEDFDNKIERLYELKKYFTAKLEELPDVTINAKKENVRDTAPHIISASFSGVRAEVLLHTLEAKDIYVSSGSACSSNKPALSATLSAIGVKRELLDSTLRFSLSVETTKEEIDHALSVLSEELPKLRKYSRR